MGLGAPRLAGARAVASSVNLDQADDESAMTARTRRLRDGVLNHQRSALAQAVTLVESTHPARRAQAQLLLTSLQRHVRAKEGQRARPTMRLGISGSPGVGKSTFIEAFGQHLLGSGLRLGVLTVDPSSTITGGSILGDKTRMPVLSAHPDAYVRPSPSSGSLGLSLPSSLAYLLWYRCSFRMIQLLARNTTDAIVLCEAFGADVVLVETVGVGQSEVAVADMVDMFILLLPPAGGDELQAAFDQNGVLHMLSNRQGIKRGIMEVSDLIIINKADGDLTQAAHRARVEHQNALHLMRRKSRNWDPEVVATSALEHRGISEVKDVIDSFYDAMMASGELMERRSNQYERWMWRHVQDDLMQRFHQHDGVKALLPEITRQMRERTMTPGVAAEHLIATFTA
ncbi:uncharacterized protein MONBRDRAFT_29095 [Monosiga brevicollis MX1]|uniref:AAA+ ATPase domain-containing protein n=1 Tax=Monosiga brevicollis TaxID=81824 RepID=A9VA39_MONBE|nr:uncharacterized protein MONBRDRAFT_29095 [Monosiga brevicollis MX1]EDQ85661.1 predicted protein [Monosiga brevicollis MX1]|eukprot:XP_001749610.1 hypothetical protein [Monosiga brevicollis MX1]